MSSLKWVLGIGAVAVTFGGVAWVARNSSAASRRVAARVPYIPENIDPVAPDVSDLMQDALVSLESEFPGVKSCYRRGGYVGPTRPPQIGFQERYEIYEHIGRKPGGPRWIAAYAWRSPDGFGQGTPGMDTIEQIWEEIGAPLEAGRAGWESVNVDARGTWRQWSLAC